MPLAPTVGRGANHTTKRIIVARVVIINKVTELTIPNGPIKVLVIVALLTKSHDPP